MASLTDFLGLNSKAAIQHLYVYNTTQIEHLDGGRCCLYIVPRGTSYAYVEMWGGGGDCGLWKSTDGGAGFRAWRCAAPRRRGSRFQTRQNRWNRRSQNRKTSAPQWLRCFAGEEAVEPGG